MPVSPAQAQMLLVELHPRLLGAADAAAHATEDDLFTSHARPRYPLPPAAAAAHAVVSVVRRAEGG